MTGVQTCALPIFLVASTLATVSLVVGQALAGPLPSPFTTGQVAADAQTLRTQSVVSKELSKYAKLVAKCLDKAAAAEFKAPGSTAGPTNKLNPAVCIASARAKSASRIEKLGAAVGPDCLLDADGDGSFTSTDAPLILDRIGAPTIATIDATYCTDPPPVCTPGATLPCYGGPAGTAGVGACHAGAQACLPDGSGYGACTGEVTPQAEVCGNGIDDNCDGVVDGGC